MCAKAGMKNNSSFRKSFFAVPTPNRNGMTNRNFTLISLMIRSSASKALSNLFCMNLPEEKSIIIPSTRDILRYISYSLRVSILKDNEGHYEEIWFLLLIFLKKRPCCCAIGAPKSTLRRAPFSSISRGLIFTLIPSKKNRGSWIS